jgi:hypothetical protein
MAALAPAPKAQFFDANGAPLVGGKLYSYSAGTTTPLVTYTDQAGTSANTNPVILDARGEANVWLGTGPYKLRLTSATDVDIWTVDNIYNSLDQSSLPAYLASPAAIGGTAPAAVSSTNLSYTGTLTGGTGVVALGTNQFYKDSSGNIGIGTTTLGSGLGHVRVTRNVTGNVISSLMSLQPTVLQDVTTQMNVVTSAPATAAASFTLATLVHYRAAQGAIGSGSSVTTQVGFFAENSLTAATNTAGFYGDIASGIGRWNFYAPGTAANWFSGDVLVFGAGGLGYTTGSGGAVTQATSRTTGVTLNKTNGAITLVSAAGTAAWQTFTVTNSTVAATDVVQVCQKSGADLYEIHVTAVAAGSFNISFRTTGGTTTEQPVFNFAVIKAVTA